MSCKMEGNQEKSFIISHQIFTLWLIWYIFPPWKTTRDHWVMAESKSVVLSATHVLLFQHVFLSLSFPKNKNNNDDYDKEDSVIS